MQITRAADYAVRVMILMASQPEGSVVSKAHLVKTAEVPESFLSKILQALARAGLVQIRRGVLGGNTLTVRGEKASLLDVVEAIDGPVLLNRCLDGQSCHRQIHCSAHNVWMQAQDAMMSVLTTASIAGLASSRGSTSSLLTISHAEDTQTVPALQSRVSSGKAVISHAPRAAQATRRTANRNPNTKG